MKLIAEYEGEDTIRVEGMPPTVEGAAGWLSQLGSIVAQLLPLALALILFAVVIRIMFGRLL